MRSIVSAVVIAALGSGCGNGGSPGAAASPEPGVAPAPPAGKGGMARARFDEDVARAVAKKLAYEAYPQWAMRPSNSGCPTVEQLAEYLERADAAIDPWGNAYVIRCGPDLPAGAYGIAVLSRGPDGREGTADDRRSWDE